MKRYIKSSYEPGWVKQGFLFTLGHKQLFLESESVNLTEKVIRKIINKVCDIKGVGDSIRESALYDKDTLKDFRYRISKASLICKSFDNGQKWYTIAGNNFQLSYPNEEEFNDEVIVFQ